MSKFLHHEDEDNNGDAKATAIPRVFSKSSRANKLN